MKIDYLLHKISQMTIHHEKEISAMDVKVRSRVKQLANSALETMKTSLEKEYLQMF
jgi:hypothetical protein